MIKEHNIIQVIRRLSSITIRSLDSFFFSTNAKASEAPYIRDAVDLKRYMVTVLICLMPTMLAGLYLYGLRVLAVIAVSYIFGVGSELVFAAWRRQEELHEGAFVTCMIYALILPPTVPLWIVAVGIVFGTVFAKELFGGTGKNIFNPAMAGRIFISLAFPEDMTMYWIMPFDTSLPAGLGAWIGDTVTCATALAIDKAELSLRSLFWGQVPGCIGETVKPLIIAGGLGLMFTKVSNWRIPLTFVISAMVTATAFHMFDPDTYPSAWFHLLSGGFLFAAAFMVSDPVTSPLTRAGKWYCGIMMGVLTIVIRTCTGYDEGVMFAVIIANTFSPLIDHLVIAYKFRKIKNAH